MNLLPGHPKGKSPQIEKNRCDTVHVLWAHYHKENNSRKDNHLFPQHLKSNDTILKKSLIQKKIIVKILLELKYNKIVAYQNRRLWYILCDIYSTTI